MFGTSRMWIAAWRRATKTDFLCISSHSLRVYPKRMPFKLFMIASSNSSTQSAYAVVKPSLNKPISKTGSRRVECRRTPCWLRWPRSPRHNCCPAISWPSYRQLQFIQCNATPDYSLPFYALSPDPPHLMPSFPPQLQSILTLSDADLSLFLSLW
jgi:hypothetical protein